MTQQHLYEWIAHPELLNRDTLYELRTLLARYPYFQTVRLLYLKNLFLLHDITFGEELRRAALYIADRKVLFYLIEGERFTITPSEGKEKSSDLLGLDRTLSLIDAFLAGQPEEEQKDITQLPMDITTDYTSYLLTETEEAVPVEEIPSLKGQDLIDTFLENNSDEPLLSSQERADEPEPEEKEPERSTIYYVTDKAQQGQYIKMFKEQGMNAVILDHNIDTSFITQLEQRNEHYQFKRIDADVTDALKSDDAADLTEETNTLSDLFKKTLNNDKLTVKVESLKDADVASILTLSEQGRRMQDMMKMYAAGGMGGMDPNMFAADQTLTLNANNALVKYLFEHKDSEHSGMFAEQLYDLAMLSNQPLSAEAMTKFVKRSNDIMLLLTK